MTRKAIRRMSTGRRLTPEEAAEYRRKIAEEEADRAETRGEIRRVRQEHESHKSRLRAAIDQLRAEREARGLSLADIATRTGISKPALSRLENGHNLNPNLETLHRYAAALGKSVQLAIGDAESVKA